MRPEDEARYAGKASAGQARFFGMVANIDDNIGRLTTFLAEKGLDQNTLVVFLTDNGGTEGVPVFNAGMRGAKGSVWRGGTRGCSFWRLPGVIKPGDVTRLAAHVDVLPTLLELAGVPCPAPVKPQVEGRSLLPLLQDPQAAWEERMLVSHLGRWPKGQAEAYARRVTAVRGSRWKLIQPLMDRDAPSQLYDLVADPAEKSDVASKHPGVVRELSAHHSSWWESIRPGLVNENVTGPAVNPFKERYWQQFPLEKPAAKP